VPFLLAGPGITADQATEFTEAEAAASRRVIDPGRGVVDLLLA
jgi:2,3-bisphosphoglycerate-independent phosphoglycerate mutase